MSIPPVPRRELYINGEWQPPVHGRRIDIICPANEDKIGTIAAATAEDAERALQAAHAAFKRGTWSGLSGSQRARFLRAIAKKVGRQRC